MIPVAGGAVLAGENGMSTELIPRETLEGNGLTHVEAGAHHCSVAERLRIGALLEFISCNKHENVVGQEKKSTRREIKRLERIIFMDPSLSHLMQMTPNGDICKYYT